MINSIKGMKDIFSPENKQFEFCIQICSKVAKNFGFEFISTPILEETTLFKRSVGESSDIVGKEMYQFIDKGNTDVCMRPEGTAGVVRAFIQAKMDKAGAKKRFFYYGPMFRYEKPQKGRLRQFHQFGVESFGCSDAKEDASIILMLNSMLKELGIKAKLKLNSLGCQKCMPEYRKKLISFLEQTEGLCEDCTRRKSLNPIRVLDCKNIHCQELIQDAPLLKDNLCDECQSDFIKLRFWLDEFGMSYELDSKLVRGLDYYSKTAFEFVSDEIGAQGSIAGGGRYDRLVEFLDGKSTAGIGFAMGIERLMELVKLPENKKDVIYLGGLDELSLDLIFKLGISIAKEQKINIEYKAKKIQKHLEAADKINAKWCLCIGEKELENNNVWLKNLQSKEEFNVSIKEIENRKWKW